MNTHDTAPHTRPGGASRPAWLVVAIGLIGLTVLAMGVRQLTIHLTAADVGTAAVSATAEHSATAAPEADAATDPADQSPAGDAKVTVGQVVVDEPYVHSPRPDIVAIEPAAPAGARAADLPGTDAGGSSTSGGGDSGAGDDDTSGGGPGTVSGSADDTADRPADGTVDLALGVRVETTGHFATVAIGIGGALRGLSSLQVGFGDGAALQLDDDQVAALATSGRMTVVHEYEPTLTPQPQSVLVTATDADGRAHTRTVEFATRAEYLLTYSALAVTALDDCDLTSKGDFTLTWRLDSRPARQSNFQLGKGDTHVEPGFRIGVNGVRYDEPVEFFFVRIEENDAGPGDFTPEAFQQLPGGGPVAQLDNHHYEVTLHAEDVENAGPAGSSLHWDCDVDMMFTVYVTMIDSPDRR